ncbi:MAG TPA: hypothetical protein VFU14_20260 [Acidimicrobiales bacterium]|nr:hypothetical protein [Acidimicrobiales bacterium]
MTATARTHRGGSPARDAGQGADHAATAAGGPTVASPRPSEFLRGPERRAFLEREGLVEAVRAGAAQAPPLDDASIDLLRRLNVPTVRRSEAGAA